MNKRSCHYHGFALDDFYGSSGLNYDGGNRQRPGLQFEFMGLGEEMGEDFFSPLCQRSCDHAGINVISVTVSRVHTRMGTTVPHTAWDTEDRVM